MARFFFKKVFISFIFILSLAFIHSAIACPLCKQKYITNDLGKEQCIDVGGYQLYLQTAGTSGPEVIFESGLGDSSWSWDKVVPQVAKFSQTFIYDRNGLGLSQTKPHESSPRTAQQAVDNIRILLKKAKINPPYILVGHSLGGLYMQLFAQEYPKDVSAVVLVDSATRDQNGDEPLPPKDAKYYLEAAGMKESIQQVRAAPPFPNVPLIILTSGQRGPEWLNLQKKLEQLSTKSEHIVTDVSGHYIQREQPDLVINAVKQATDLTQHIPHAKTIALINDFTNARNKHDTSAMLSLFDDNVIWRTSWGDILRGKAALKGMFEKQAKDHIHNEIVNITKVTDDTIELVRQATMDSWEKMGIDALYENSKVTISNGKIIRWENEYTPESAKKLEAAKARN